MTWWIVTTYNTRTESWINFGPFPNDNTAEYYSINLPSHYTEVSLHPLTPAREMRPDTN